MASSSRYPPPELEPERVRTLPPENPQELVMLYVKVDDENQTLSWLVDMFDEIGKKRTYVVYSGPNFEEIGAELSDKSNCLLLKHDCAQNGFPKEQHLDTISSISGSRTCRVLMTDDAVYDSNKLKKVPLVVNFDFPENSDILIKRMSLAGKDHAYNKAIVLYFLRNEKQLQNLKKIERKYNVPVFCEGREFLDYFYRNNIHE